VERPVIPPLIEVDNEEFLRVMEEPMPAHPSATFDRDEFQLLLAGSYSLKLEEKLGLLRDITTLSEPQIHRIASTLRKEQHDMLALARRYRSRLHRAQRRRCAPALRS
jgi:hypothetical protein